jgi:hypothetical protein
MIREHPTLRFEARPGWDNAALVVECDFCRKMAKRTGVDPGEAAEAARKEGFQTIRGKFAASPRTWWCGCCERVP